MSKMLGLELVGLLLLTCTPILTEYREYHGPRNQYGHRTTGSHHSSRTREIHIKYGRLRGTVVQPKGDNLQLVDVFLGVPYAEPPVRGHRFEPPTAQRRWNGVLNFNSFAPVCPQVLPNVSEVVDANRHRYLKRLLPFLQNQSEDCLYLNIYAPHQNNSQKNNLEKYPVMVFIHGESYEWNSGNPYDGGVLAAYGNIVFVTVNFRLGILGFLRPGTEDTTASNFGLLDQIAALIWLQENIGQFGGDPNSITLIGHGTGAVFVNLLLLSPIIQQQNLVKRAILMSGSALNPDAIGKAPLQITKQVAYALNCPQINDSVLVACLKNRSVDDLLHVKIHKPKYVPSYPPLVDRAVLKEHPMNLMKNAENLARFDLMYGVTELEKFHALPGVALLEGMARPGRDEFIRESVKASHELEDDRGLLLGEVLKFYEKTKQDDRPRNGDEYFWNRDLALEIVSDSEVVAPLVMTANLHSRANPKSYMYVFSHLRSIRDNSMEQQIQHTVHGEELAYVLGVPLEGEGYHLSAPYDKGEAILSKAMMDWWCNFAYSGNPNNVRPPPRRLSYYLEDYRTSWSYNIDWPEYDPDNQTYFNLTTPPQIGRGYRAAEMEFWNELVPEIQRPRPPAISTTETPPSGGRSRRPGLLDLADRDYANNASGGAVPANVVNVDSSTPRRAAAAAADDDDDDELQALSNLGDGKPDNNDRQKTEESEGAGDSGDGGGGGGGPLRNSSAISLVIGFGVVFLLINATILFCLYHKRQRMREKEAGGGGGGLAQAAGRRLGNVPAGACCSSVQDAVAVATLAKRSKTEHRELGYCYSASKPDIRDIIKNDKAYDNNSNFGRRSRENSSSTIDTRVKVREWIQQEIVHRCSPHFLRKTRETLQREHREKLMKQQQERHLANMEDEEEQQQLYAESQQIRVRPGVRKPASGPAKVSVAVDATPATRTDSILNQIPIELGRVAANATASSEYLNSFEDAATTILGTSDYCEPAEFRPADQLITDKLHGGPNIVVIEHHHSRSDPLPMEKLPGYSASKAIRINESDSGSASSLYAKINPKMKSRLPVQHTYQKNLKQQQQQQPCDARKDHEPTVAGVSTTLPRLLTFGSAPAADVNVTSRDPATAGAASEGSSSHEEALRTIRRRNYPKVLPDIEKRRSLPPNVTLPRQLQQPGAGHRPPAPPSPPPRIYGTSRSLDCVEDKNENEEDTVMPVTTNLHVGPLVKKTDSPKNQSVPSLADIPSDSPTLSSAVSLPVCPVHGNSREPMAPGARSEPRIVITPITENNERSQATRDDGSSARPAEEDQPDCPRRPVPPERSTKLPRIIIKPTTVGGTLPRCRPGYKPNAVPIANPNGLHDNEAYRRLVARREKMPLPGELAAGRRREPPPPPVDAGITKL